MMDFTDTQRKTLVRGLTALSCIAVAAFSVVVVWAVFKLLAIASSAIIPVVLGFLLALFFKPYYAWWKKTLRNPTFALVVMLATVFVPLGLLVWCAGSLAVDAVIGLIHQLPTLAAQVTDWAHATFPRLKPTLAAMGIDMSSLSSVAADYGTKAIKVGSGAFKLLGGVFTALIAILFFVFFLTTKDRSGRDIVRHLPFLKEETQLFVAEQFDAFFDILIGFFQRQIVICLIEGVYYGAGFWLVGLPYGFLIGFSLGVMNLIPLFGSVVCMPVALPLAFFAQGGSLTRLLLVAGVWGLGQLLDGYLITPRIQGNKTGLGYAGVIFSFIFWGTLLGPLLGMLLAIPLSAFWVVLWRAVKSRYIRPVV